MGDQDGFFSHSPEGSRDRLIAQLGDFLFAFPLYSHGARAGEYAAEAAANMLVHAAVLSGRGSSELVTSHLFLAGTSLLALGRPTLFVNSLADADEPRIVGLFLHEIADQVHPGPRASEETPLLTAPDLSLEFLDCTAMGCLNKSLEAANAEQEPEDEMQAQLEIALVLLQAAIGYDLHMGETDHALAVWASLAILASGDIEIPNAARIPEAYKPALAACLHSLGDSYLLAKDFAYIYS